MDWTRKVNPVIRAQEAPLVSSETGKCVLDLAFEIIRQIQNQKA
jgi:hypothetical protein